MPWDREEDLEIDMFKFLNSYFKIFLHWAFVHKNNYFSSLNMYPTNATLQICFKLAKYDDIH